MTKVSKNLKKIRTSKNLTQDALASELYVTRQTISGWENGRTQPDIEMLIKIAQVLEVDVEELIYGVKKNADEDAKSQNTKRVLTTIFAIIAAVLMGTGLILIFVTGWEKFPDALKSVFAFVPILVGQSAAVFTYIRHKDSIAWREGASVLWCAGIGATVALVNSVFDINGGFANCLLADAMMFLPVIYVLDAVTPLIVYYGSTIYYCLYLFELNDNIIPTVVMLVLYLAGFAYVIINRKKTDDVRHIYTLWISLIAAYAIVFINSIVLAQPYITLFASMAFFLFLYILDKNESWASPFKTIGITGITAVSVASVVLFNPEISVSDNAFVPYTIAFTVFSLILVISAVLIGRKSFEHNILKIVYCSFSAVCMLTEIVYWLFGTERNIVTYILILLCSFGMSLTLITQGAMTGKFVPLNFGLVTTAVLIGIMTVSLIEISMLTAGILLLIFGIVIFTVNFILARKMKTERKEEGGIICVKNQD